mgnify:CR=1 FL=1
MLTRPRSLFVDAFGARAQSRETDSMQAGDDDDDDDPPPFMDDPLQDLKSFGYG